jgi:hypothetical protein
MDFATGVVKLPSCIEAICLSGPRILEVSFRIATVLGRSNGEGLMRVSSGTANLA